MATALRDDHGDAGNASLAAWGKLVFEGQVADLADTAQIQRWS